ncbi:MAG: RnfH family protein [Burkholderiales bacterium]|nr:RnfH family protein [Burkholderiales bacterium]
MDKSLSLDAEKINISICYARPGLQVLRHLQVDKQCTIQQAVLQSEVMQEVPEIDISSAKVGIFGKLKSLDTVLREQDRIEIYRPLIADPKESRRKRAAKK